MTRSSRVIRIVVAIAVAGVAAFLSGCGSSSSSSGAGTSASSAAATTSGSSGSSGSSTSSGQASVAAAQAAIKNLAPGQGQAGAITAWPGPTSEPPASAVPKNKLLVVVTCGDTSGCDRQANGAAAAAKAIGWQTKIISGQSNPKVENEAIMQAINLHANMIMSVALTYPIVGTSVAAAQRAGIPVIVFGTTDVPGPHEYNWTELIPLPQVGTAEALWTTVKTGGQGTFGLMYDPEFPSTVAMDNNFKNTLLKYCKDCKIGGTMNIAYADINTTVPGAVVAFLEAHPDIHYMFVPFDEAVTPAVAAIRAAGLQKRVKFITQGGEEPNMSDLASGSDLQMMDAAVPYEWGGWGTVDDFRRILAHTKPVDQNLPFRLFFAGEKDVPTGFYTGDYDYQAKYKSLWGVQ